MLLFNGRSLRRRDVMPLIEKTFASMIANKQGMQTNL